MKHLQLCLSVLCLTNHISVSFGLMFKRKGLGSTPLKASATQMLSVARKKKKANLPAPYNLCFFCSYLSYLVVLYSLLPFFASGDFSLFVFSVSFTAAKQCASMCQQCARPGQVRLQTTWSSQRCPCPRQGVGTG